MMVDGGGHCAHVLEIQNATVYRGSTRVFENFSLTIEGRRNTAILGPNGAGKTTLLKLLQRELYPVHSEPPAVRIFGQDRWDVWELRAHLGVVSSDLQQHYGPYVSGRDVVLSGYYSSIGTYDYQNFSTEDLACAADVMETLGVSELEDKLFASMSTGQQRRFLLARALVNEPDTLVLDEPTSGLDLTATFHYLQTMRTLMQSGRTLILVTHHIHEIPPEVSHIVLLRAGRVVMQGPKESVLTDDNLSVLFDTPVKLLAGNGYYQAIPG
ncbi:MAG: ATP-binding cassette domain-containing protein [Gammaproteobacteria bacterium]|nr:ATP-binding cassette domain-containing protein [Gammaproteobacteria bacterium]